MSGLPIVLNEVSFGDKPPLSMASLSCEKPRCKDFRPWVSNGLGYCAFLLAFAQPHERFILTLCPILLLHEAW